MKLPAVGIAAAFASGIALGLYPAVVPHVTSAFFLSPLFLSALVLIVTGLAFAKLERLLPAAVTSLLSWTLLGLLAACAAEQPLPANHVTSLVKQGRLSLQTPLRWHGRLRDEPAKLPWGYGLEIDLRGVEYQGSMRPALGGLRVSFTPHPDENPLPELHAGGLGLTFRVWELLVVTMALQMGMLPLMARDFHRVSLSAPIVNLRPFPGSEFLFLSAS